MWGKMCNGWGWREGMMRRRIKKCTKKSLREIDCCQLMQRDLMEHWKHWSASTPNSKVMVRPI